MNLDGRKYLRGMFEAHFTQTWFDACHRSKQKIVLEALAMNLTLQ